MSTIDGRQHQAAEAKLEAELEETWQSESPTTASATDFADEVDGELGTRDRASESAFE